MTALAGNVLCFGALLACIAAPAGAAFAAAAPEVAFSKTADSVLSAEEDPRVIPLSAEFGDGKQQGRLGLMYLYGLGGLAKDRKEAEKWLRKAAEQGAASAQSDLGVMYCKGLGGLDRDFGKAGLWFRAAADRKDPNGWYNLGVMRTRGWGVDRDLKMARKWLGKAAKRGHAEAAILMGGAKGAGSSALGMHRGADLGTGEFGILRLRDSTTQRGLDEAFGADAVRSAPVRLGKNKLYRYPSIGVTIETGDFEGREAVRRFAFITIDGFAAGDATYRAYRGAFHPPLMGDETPEDIRRIFGPPDAELLPYESVPTTILDYKMEYGMLGFWFDKSGRLGWVEVRSVR